MGPKEVQRLGEGLVGVPGRHYYGVVVGALRSQRQLNVDLVEDVVDPFASRTPHRNGKHALPDAPISEFTDRVRWGMREVAGDEQSEPLVAPGWPLAKCPWPVLD